MASHRKPPRRARTATASRAIATFAMAGALTTAWPATGQAAAPLDPEQVQAQASELYRQAEQATEVYDGAREEADAARRRLDGLDDELARRTEQLNRARDRLGAIAAARYRTGGLDPAVQLMLSDRPGQYLQDAGLLQRAADEQGAALRELARQQQFLRRLRTEAAGRLGSLADDERRLAAARQAVTDKLAQARELLGQLAPAGEDPADGGTGSAEPPAADVRLPVRAPGLRATEAVAFAVAQLGKPYVWGATGPGSYDCSGLVQAAWRAAGVELPRTTYSQITAGSRVPESALQPGDLVFFYPGVSHVGIYIGGGQMIHAPHPGAPVRIAPVSEMPFAGAVRPV